MRAKGVFGCVGMVSGAERSGNTTAPRQATTPFLPETRRFGNLPNMDGLPIVYRKTCKRYNIPGHAHYLTFSCFHRLPLLARDRSRQWVVDAVTSAREGRQFDVWAYVIMPEHVHLIVWPREASYDISTILASIKAPAARQAIAFLKGNASYYLATLTEARTDPRPVYRFWQRGGGYDRNLYSAEETWEKIDYLHNNPIRRGLCQAPVEWIWSSAADYAGIGKGPIPLDLGALPPRPMGS